MTSLTPREPYSEEELEKLYPNNLKLQLVQVLLRHGERSPVSSRFQNAGLPAFWPYCSVARQLLSATMDNNTSHWGALEWRRRLETFGPDDDPVIASGPHGQVDAVCNLGELTDQGRRSTHALGRRLRHLYVNQLKFMPSMISDADMIYLRATPIPRALESLQEAFWGMYPSQTRTGSFPPPTIITRAPADETLFPNDGNCRRFAQLSRAFAQRTADRWNKSPEMDYLNTMISKWMPEKSKRVAVDSHPRLSGIMDTINSTLAHGPETQLPKEFYDQKVREIIDKISVEEWFSGYHESEEYRSLGIGALIGDIVSRMVGSVEKNGNDGLLEVGGPDGALARGRGGETAIKLGLSGCHDTTLAAVLVSLGVFGNEPWPPYTSHIALELFRRADMPEPAPMERQRLEDTSLVAASGDPKVRKSWFGRLFGDNTGKVTDENGDVNTPLGIARKKVDELPASERSKLGGYFVRIRYNDKVMTVPGCKVQGKHLDGDESFCTLVSLHPIDHR
jgi:acid phosphatase